MLSVNVDQIDYQALVSELSQEPNYPYSLHLRNHLIAPYAALPYPPPAHEQDAWKTYTNYRRGAQLIAIGNVPTTILKGSVSKNGAMEQAGPWGVAVLFPAYSSNAVAEKENEKAKSSQTAIWHSMRLSLWLNSESNGTGLAATFENVKIAEKEDIILLHSIFNDFLPRAIQNLVKIQGQTAVSTTFDQSTTLDHMVDLFAVNDAWVRILDQWTKERHSTIKLTRANPCMSFIKSELESLSPSSQMAPRWHVSSIQCEKEAVLVQSSNSLTFPIWYINQRKHISVLIRDGEDVEGGKSTSYPTSIQSGSPAAWAYAHDDLSLASLHVAEPYRRLRLGKCCVDIMAKRLIDAQKQALKQAGCTGSKHSTPYLLDTEMHKGSSRLFFEAIGFTGFVIATWGSISVQASQDILETQ